MAEKITKIYFSQDGCGKFIVGCFRNAYTSGNNFTFYRKAVREIFYNKQDALKKLTELLGGD